MKTFSFATFALLSLAVAAAMGEDVKCQDCVNAFAKVSELFKLAKTINEDSEATKGVYCKNNLGLDNCEELFNELWSDISHASIDYKKRDNNVCKAMKHCELDAPALEPNAGKK